MEDCSAHVYVLVMYLNDVYIIVFIVRALSSVRLNECD